MHYYCEKQLLESGWNIARAAVATFGLDKLIWGGNAFDMSYGRRINQRRRRRINLPFRYATDICVRGAIAPPIPRDIQTPAMPGYGTYRRLDPPSATRQILTV